MTEETAESTVKPLIGLTMGDPRGVSAEVGRVGLLKLGGLARWVAYAPDGYFGADLDHLDLIYRPPAQAQPVRDAIERSAVELADGTIDGVVTGPVDKQVFTGDFPGHTELYAARCGVSDEDVAMWMAGPRLNVVPVTRHVALADVPSLLNARAVTKAGVLVGRAVTQSLGRPARIAVAGLNPHAGDGGLFGDEEARILAPAVANMCAAGIDATGPHSPDTVFTQALAGRFDAVVCGYHDQGLIPFKLIHFSDGVNVTLGLPRPRTSPDHGPAFDIAGRGVADANSMIHAMRLAIALSAGDPPKDTF